MEDAYSRLVVQYSCNMKRTTVLFAVLCVVSVASGTLDFTTVIDKFATKLVKSLHESSYGGNIIVSALSIQMLVALYSAGLKPLVREQIMRGMFEGQNEQEVWQYFKSLRQNLSANGVLELANKMYYSVWTGHGVCPAFEGHAHGFGAELEMISFTNGPEAKINQWVRAKSNGKIRKMFEDSELPFNTESVIVNMMNFKGTWDIPFNKSFTQKRVFQLNKNQNVTKEFVDSRFPTKMKYVEDDELKAKAVELKYKEAGFRMIVVVPDEVDGLPRVLSELASKGLGPILDAMKNERVAVKMPKFDFTFSVNLKEELSKIGVNYLFNQPATDIICNQYLYISKAFQKTAISVDENGTQAAAGSGIIPYSDSPNNNKYVTADHPFYLAILQDNTTVFAGTYDR